MTRCTIFAALALFTPAALADDALVERLLGELGAERTAEREAAKGRLLVLGAPAIARALAVYEGSPPRVRAEIVDLIARGGGEAEIRKVLPALDDPDEYVARTAAGYLLDDLGPDRLDPALEGALEAGAVKTERGRALAAGILRSHLYERVEMEVRSKVTPGGGMCFYDGQFAELQKMGEGVPEVVLTMFLEGARYEYLHPVADGEERAKLEFLVGEALVDVANEGMRSLLHEEYREAASNEDRQKVIEAALAQAGDLSLVQAKIRKLESDMRRSADPDHARHELALLYYRIRMHDKSLALYQQILARRPGDTLALYNMACALTRLGRIDEAFSALERAQSLGYDVLAIGDKDGDLAALRSDPRWARFVRRR